MSEITDDDLAAAARVIASPAGREAIRRGLAPALEAQAQAHAQAGAEAITAYYEQRGLLDLAGRGPVTVKTVVRVAAGDIVRVVEERVR
jgi:hypothetical protein